MPENYFNFYRVTKKIKPDFILNRFSIHSSHVAKLLGITSIGFSDTEHASGFHKITLPFIDIKFSGKSYYNNLGKNHLKLDSNIELFYLHPSVFKSEFNAFERLGIKDNTPYSLVRFVSWQAHHDTGVKIMPVHEKIQLVKHLSERFKVFISSEGPLPETLEKYRVKIRPDEIHTILKYASLYIGEGGTMASEAACLDTPVIYTNPLPLMGYLKEQKQNGLLHHLTDLKSIIELVASTSYLNNRNFQEYIESKINPTAFMVWFIENYPSSARIMKENPDYQYRFK